MRFTAQITDGRLIVDEPKRLQALLAKWDGKRATMDLTHRRQVRSLDANRYLWGVVYEIIAEWSGHEPEEIHEYFKWKLLTPHEDRFPNGETFERVSTADLDSKEFSEYVDKVRQQAAEWGLYIPSPNEPPESYA